MTSASGASTAPVRRRDPDRRGKILAAATRLFADNSYHAVSLSEIGAEAGIVGSGIYRHFDRKYSVLVTTADDPPWRYTRAVLVGDWHAQT